MKIQRIKQLQRTYSSSNVQTNSSLIRVNSKTPSHKTLKIFSNILQFNLEEQQLYNEFQEGNDKQRVTLLVQLNENSKMRKSKLFRTLLRQYCESQPYFQKFSQSLSIENLNSFYKLIHIKTFQERDMIIEYGDIGKEMFYLIEGEAGVLVPKTQEELEKQQEQLKLQQQQKQQQELEMLQEEQPQQNLENIEYLSNNNIDSPLKKSKQQQQEVGFSEFVKQKYSKFNLVKILGRNLAFGEVALEHKSRRTAHVIAKSNTCSVVQISIEAYREFIQKEQQKAREEEISKLLNLSIFNDWRKEGITIIMDHICEEKSYRVGDIIYQEGEGIENLYILDEGEVQIYYKVPDQQFQHEGVPQLIQQDILKPQYAYIYQQIQVIEEEQQGESRYDFDQIFQTMKAIICGDNNIHKNQKSSQGNVMNTEESEKVDDNKEVNQLKNQFKKQRNLAGVASISAVQCFGEYELFSIFNTTSSQHIIKDLLKQTERVSKVVCKENVKVRVINIQKYLQMQYIYGMYMSRRDIEDVIEENRVQNVEKWVRLTKEIEERQIQYNNSMNLRQQFDEQKINQINAEELDIFIPQAIKMKIPGQNQRPITVSHSRSLKEKQMKYTQAFQFQKLLNQQEQLKYKPSLSKPLKIFNVPHSKVLLLLQQESEDYQKKQEQKKQSYTSQRNKAQVPLAFPKENMKKLISMQKKKQEIPLSNNALSSKLSVSPTQSTQAQIESQFITSQKSTRDLFEEMFSPYRNSKSALLSPQASQNQITSFQDIQQQQQDSLQQQKQQQQQLQQQKSRRNLLQVQQSPKQKLEIWRHLERVKQNFENIESENKERQKLQKIESKKSIQFSPVQSPRNSVHIKNSSSKKNSNQKFQQFQEKNKENNTKKQQQLKGEQDQQDNSNPLFKSKAFVQEMKRLMVGREGLNDIQKKKKKLNQGAQLTNFQKYQQHKRSFNSLYLPECKNYEQDNIFTNNLGTTVNTMSNIQQQKQKNKKKLQQDFQQQICLSQESIMQSYMQSQQQLQSDQKKKQKEVSEQYSLQQYKNKKNSYSGKFFKSPQQKIKQEKNFMYKFEERIGKSYYQSQIGSPKSQTSSNFLKGDNSKGRFLKSNKSVDNLDLMVTSKRIDVQQLQIQNNNNGKSLGGSGVSSPIGSFRKIVYRQNDRSQQQQQKQQQQEKQQYDIHVSGCSEYNNEYISIQGAGK